MRQDIYNLVSSGESLSEEEAAELEKQLLVSSDDVATRIKLLGCYAQKQYSDPEICRIRTCHVLWLIEYCPESGVLEAAYGLLIKEFTPAAYEEGKMLWMKHLVEQSRNIAVLKNAVQYFMLSEMELAETVLMKLRELEPSEPEWVETLGHLYALHGQRKTSADERRLRARKSLEQYELAYKLTIHARDRDALLKDLSKIAFRAEEYEKAVHFAERMVAEPDAGWSAGNNIHYGNIVLGHVALARGEKERAASYLTAAGKTKGSPQLNSFGPNMTLAKALYEVGERGAVLEYLDECSRFWSMDRGRLTEWQQQVEAGEAAFVSGNIRY